MHLGVIPCKTDRARDALLRRDSLPRNQRMFLIMIDGRKSLRDLSEAADQLGIDSVALSSMVNAGLIRWQEGPGATAPVPAPAASAPSQPPRAVAKAAPSLAAAKLYAMDLAALMLPGQDGELRAAARQVTDADGLRAWLADSARAIGTRAGADRASLFLERVGAMLPADFFEAIATSA